MICDECIVQLNVAYTFKKKAIEADNKMKQYIIEKGIGFTDFTHAITDGSRGTSFLTDFAVPEPLRHITLHPETTALAHEYLRNFETPQSMASNVALQPKPGPSNQTNGAFRCMPIQIKTELFDDGADQVSPSGASEENLQTVSDTSSIRSTMNRINNGRVVINQLADHLANCSDEEYINHYLGSHREQTLKVPPSESEKSPSSSKSTGTSKTSHTIDTTVTNKTGTSDGSSSSTGPKSNSSTTTSNKSGSSIKTAVKRAAAVTNNEMIKKGADSKKSTENQGPSELKKTKSVPSTNETKDVESIPLSQRRKTIASDEASTGITRDRKRTQTKTVDEPKQKRGRPSTSTVSQKQKSEATETTSTKRTTRAQVSADKKPAESSRSRGRQPNKKVETAEVKQGTKSRGRPSTGRKAKDTVKAKGAEVKSTRGRGASQQKKSSQRS